MPHGSGGDDLASSDEIKVFKDEGEEEKRSSENLTDLKSSLVTEGEEQDVSTARGLTPTSGLCRFLQEKIVGLPGQSTAGYASPKPARPDAFGSLFESMSRIFVAHGGGAEGYGVLVGIFDKRSAASRFDCSVTSKWFSRQLGR
ncbi:hypothetical protein HPB48_005154 [Haemaphysalis longicornis]|uniref:CTNNB1 binding N-teminal domain-containing protein n=1 Tax=Haemaphysalis longicornis TaxID=44386 RepID=A0A9J6FFE5_HAELO|nr:hypothetical protein HPB48_005154 [Haemaphysalis longicornis]